MHIINAQFERLSDISIADALGEIGVYILWDGRAITRPSYIGEGNILRRLVDHADRFYPPLDGYAAKIEGHTPRWEKVNAEIVEALLLIVAEETDRATRGNSASGKVSRIVNIFNKHGVLRVNVRGFDPFVHPAQARPLSATKTIEVVDSEEPDNILKHDWRKRHRRK